MGPEDTQSLIHTTARSQLLLQALESMNDKSLASDQFIIDLRGFCERGRAELTLLQRAGGA